MSMKYQWVLLLAFSLITFNLSAQPGGPFVPTSSASMAPTSPQAYQFQKFGETPVDIQSGVPEINIPLHALRFADLSWNFGLRYNAKGFKTSEMATSTGLGWTLEGNGIITTTVVGANDLTSPLVEDSMILRRFMDLSSTTVDGVNCFYYNPQDISRAGRVLTNLENFQPDLFNLSMPGKSLKFFIYKDTGYAIPATDDKIIVIKNPLGIEGTIITVQDTRGVKYFFSYKGYNKALTGCNYGQMRINLSKSPIFYIDSIKTMKGEIVRFSYHVETYNYTAAPSIGYNENVTDVGPCGQYNPGQYAQTCTSNYTVEEAVLDKIVSTSGDSILLKYSARADITGSSKLDTIVVGFNGLSRRLMFYNSYFGNQNDNNLRLRLDSIASLDLLSGSVADKYRFQYNSTVLPPISSLAFDYYGYFNGASGNTGVNPKSYFHEASLVKAKACVLERLVYPTGGITDFNYEYNENDGGLRIASIEDRTSTDPMPFRRSYEYWTDVSVLNPSFRTSHSGVYTYSQNYANCSYYRYSSHRIAGSPYPRAGFGYSRVIESFGYNGEFGKVEYEFVRSPNYDYNKIATPKKLSKKTSFSRFSETQFRKIKEETFVYVGADPTLNTSEDGIMFFDPKSKKEKRVWGVNVTKTQAEMSVRLENMTKCLPEKHTQEHFVFCSFPEYTTGKKVKEFVYGENKVDSIVTEEIIEYQSENHSQPTRILKVDSKRDTSVSSLIYAADYLPGNSTLDYLVANNISVAPIETVNYKLMKNGDKLFLSSNLIEYNEAFYPVKSFYCGESAALTLSNFKFSNSPLGQLPFAGPDQSYQLDSKYTLEEEITKFVDNRIAEVKNRRNAFVTYYWDNFGRISASVLNSLSTDVVFNSFETTGKGNLIYTGTPVAGNAFTGAYSYPLSGNNIQSSGLSVNKSYMVSYWSESGAKNVNGFPAVTKHVLGNWTCYEHIVNLTTGQIIIQGNGLVDELRIYPVNSQMTSFIYGFQKELVAQVDINNIPTYYEYDGFQRLIHIKDKQKHILQKFEYNQTGTYGAANWQFTGNTRCFPCKLNINFKDPREEREFVDINPQSGSFNSKKWEPGVLNAACTIGDVVEAAPPTCELVNGQINGYLITQTKNINPCAQNYNVVFTKREINLTACPFVCSTNNCSGVDKKCINGVCEQAVIRLTSQKQDPRGYTCTYSYVWSDGSSSLYQIVRSQTPCP